MSTHRSRAARTVAAASTTLALAAVLAGHGTGPASAWEGQPGTAGLVQGVGQNTAGVASTPARPAGDVFVRASATSETFSLHVWTDGSVSVTGDDGTPTPPGELPEPAFGGLPAAPAGSTYVGAAAGTEHGFLLTDTGLLLGFGHEVEYGADEAPVLPLGTTWEAVAAGDEFTVGLTSAGVVRAWGSSGFGRTSVPQLAPGLRYVDIDAGPRHAVALVSDGSLRTWGSTADQRTAVPPQPANGTRYLDVAASGKHTAALRSDGVVVAGGPDLDFEPVRVPPLRKPQSLALGDGHGVVLSANGHLTPFGDNGEGQLSPPTLDSSRQVVDVVADADHTLYRTAQRPTLDVLDEPRTVAWGSRPAVAVSVTAGAVQPTGRVRVVDGETDVASAPLVDGVARPRIDTSTLPVGRHLFNARYDGDDLTAPAVPDSGNVVELTVAKAVPTVKASPARRTIRAGQRLAVRVTARAGKHALTGPVTAVLGSRTLARTTLRAGDAGTRSLTLPKLGVGRHRVEVRYAGSAVAEQGSRTVVVTVRKPRGR